MKRLPLFLSLFAFAALCASVSYWGLRFFKPSVRGVVAPVQQSNFEPGTGQWGSIFGSTRIGPASGNFQLKGVVVAKRKEESLAIVVVNGKSAQAVALQHELVPGTVLKEVNEQYVLISENGVIRRVELPQSVALSVNLVPPGITRNHEEVSPKVAPVAFPPHQQAIAPPGPINPAVAPLVTPGFPTASLPAAMPGSGQ